MNEATALRSTRARWIVIVVGAFALIGVSYATYWALFLRYRQSTDDAYVSGNVVQITPQIAGTVVAISADDTEFVKAGSAGASSIPPTRRSRSSRPRRSSRRRCAKCAGSTRTTRADSQSRAVDMRGAEVARADDDLSRRERLARTRRRLGARSCSTPATARRAAR